MRWPWERVPWGRGRGADASDSAAGDAASPAPGSAGPPSSEAFQSAPARRRPPGHASLRCSAASRTARRSRRRTAFRSSLTTHQNPSFLAPLGHLVDPDGPAGVVGGLASSVGGPISYEGVDELRVPERPAPPSAPAVQRRIATLRPEPSVQRHVHAAEPTYSSDHDHDGTADTSVMETASPEVTGPVAREPAAPETPVSPPLVVARSAESPTPLPAGRPDSGDSSDSAVEETEAGQAATLGAGDTSVGSTGGASPAPEATAPAPAAPAMTPLTVPVQRSATSSGATPGLTAAPGHVGDVSSPATLRPVSSTPPTVAVPAATQPADTGQIHRPRPRPQQPSWWWRGRQRNRRPSSPTSGPVTISHRRPSSWIRAPETPRWPACCPAARSWSRRRSTPRPPPGDGPAGDTAPLTVPSGASPAQGSGPTLQRQFTDQPPATPPAGSTPVSSVGRQLCRRGAASTAGSLPNGPTAPAGSPTAGLDDQGYPPLIARSVQRSTVGTDEAGRAPALGAAAPSPGSDVPAGPQAPLSGFSAAISALQDPPSRSSARRRQRGVGGRPRWVESGSPARGGATGGTGPDRAPARTGRAPATSRHQHAPARSPTDPGATQPDRRRVSPRPAPGHTGQRSADLVGAGGAATPLRGPAAPSESHLELRSAGRSRRPAEHRRARRVSAMEMPTAPASAAWSPVAPRASGSGSSAWSSPLGPSAAESARSGASRATVQRSAAETSPPAVGTTTYPRSGEPSAPMVSPPMAAADSAPMIQRRFDAPSSGTAVTPPVSADPPAMAVSSRTVGLAEMFAMAAAQPSDGGATIQRSADTEVQPAADPPAAAPAAAPSAAPAGPAGPAAPMSGAELEEMARRLYEPLSARLRAELWQDRERSGLLTDLRP